MQKFRNKHKVIISEQWPTKKAFDHLRIITRKMKESTMYSNIFRMILY